MYLFVLRCFIIPALFFSSHLLEFGCYQRDGWRAVNFDRAKLCNITYLCENQSEFIVAADTRFASSTMCIVMLVKVIHDKAIFSRPTLVLTATLGRGESMLSRNVSDPHWNIIPRQRSAVIKNIIRQTSERLAKCSCAEIQEVIQSALGEIQTKQVAERAGWVFLSESGDIVDTFFPVAKSSFLALFKKGFREMPWCLAELNAGRVVVVRDTEGAENIDRQFLNGSLIRSIALFPSHSFVSGRGVLILSSMSDLMDWSSEIVDQCALLESIFSNAYGRRLVEGELQRSSSCFNELFIASSTGIAILNKDGAFLSANKALCKIIGYSEKELQDMLYEQLVVSFNQDKIEGLLRFFNNPRAVSRRMKQTLMCKDQTLISSRMRIYPLRRLPTEGFQTLMMMESFVEQRQVNDSRQFEARTLASQLIQSQENERKSLARELHDDIGQRLSLVASEVALLASQHSDTNSNCVNRLNALRDDLDRLCSDIHCMSHDLHSFKLQHLGLESALKDLRRRFSQPNFRIDLYVDHCDESCSEEISLCLYRIAQESLNNALKHAHASTVAVNLTKMQGMFYMAIQDSGIGFDINEIPQGLGLISMSERLKLVNGQLKVHSIPGHGTEIWIAVPDAHAPIETNCLVPA